MNADGKMQDIPTESILPNPYQPRKHFSKESLKALADSIDAVGMLQPITVRRKNATEFEVIAGERRLKATKQTGQRTISAVIRDVTDAEMAIMSLAENVQREDLTFFEEAEAYYKVIVEQGLTQQELAKCLGISQSTVANKLRLRRFSNQAKFMIQSYNLSERHARALLALEDEEMTEKVIKIIYERAYNVKRTEELVRIINSKTAGRETEALLAKRNRDNFSGGGFQKAVRVFINSLKQSLEYLQLDGVKAVAGQFERETHYEIVIRIPKKLVKITNHENEAKMSVK